MIGWFLSLFRCSHRSGFYRERRLLHGVQVLHLVCRDDCGHAVPAVKRTAREHRQIVKVGAVKIAQARRRQPPADVVTMPQKEKAS